MSSAEAGFSATVKDSKGNLLTIRGDSYDDFKANATDALGGPNAESFLNHFTAAFTGVESVGQAAANVKAAFPQSAPVAPQATIGGNVVPMPQPGQVQAQPEQPPAQLANYPGDCPHGARVYQDTMTKNGQWRRWECPVPFKQRTAPCKAVNVR